jgi:phosphatidylinositol glycan class C protein
MRGSAQFHRLHQLPSQVATVVCRDCGTPHKCVARKEPWQRILWKQQEYADNYVDETFLSTLITNANAKMPEYLSTSLATVSISQRLSVVVILVTTFFKTLHSEISFKTLILWDLILVLAGLFVTLLLQEHITRRQCWEFSVKQANLLMLFAGILYFVSPVLQTLTAAYSEDTIWALTILLGTLHVVTHDFTWLNDIQSADSQHDGSISLNTGVFAAVLLASRLACPRAVFAFMFLAFEAFVGLPLLAKRINVASPRLHIAFSALLTVVAVELLRRVSKVVMAVYVCGIAFMTLLCPLWLMWVQRFKNEMQGPWDYDEKNECKSGNL